jgi:AcrR family transcriptional regulator
MGIAERRARHKTSLRRQILDAARELFAHEGYAAVSMRKLAQRIEYSPTAIYLHFEDKDDLFRAVCDETFAGLVKRLAKQRREFGAEPLACLEAGLHEYIAFGLKHPEHYIVTFMQPMRRDSPASFAGSPATRRSAICAGPSPTASPQESSVRRRSRRRPRCCG